MRFPITSPGSTPRPARRDRGAFRLPGLAVAAALAAAVAAPAWAAGPTLLPADQAFRLRRFVDDARARGGPDWRFTDTAAAAFFQQDAVVVSDTGVAVPGGLDGSSPPEG